MLNQAPPPVPGAAPPPVRAKPPVSRAPATAKPTPLPVETTEPEESRYNGETLMAVFSSFGISLLAHLIVFSMLAFLFLRTEVEEFIGIESAIDTKKPISKIETLATDMSPLPMQKVKEQSSKRTIVPITKTGPVGGIQVDIDAPDVGTPNPGKGAGGKGKLFGTGRNARSMVFVVDCSGSMGNNGRFKLATNELIRAIKRLTSRQRFYVVFYSDETIPMFDMTDRKNIEFPRGNRRNRNPNFGRRRRVKRTDLRMVLASSTYKKRAVTWISRLRSGGGTRPEEAMEIALRMKPEVVYFLTDGDINPPQPILNVIKKENKSSVRINTIALGFPGSADLLKQIARENNKGTYTFVEE